MTIPPTPPLQDSRRTFTPDTSMPLPIRAKIRDRLLGSLQTEGSVSPPTPAPSPQPFDGRARRAQPSDPGLAALRARIGALDARERHELLQLVLADCNPSELPPLLQAIEPRLKRDFLRTLPTELALHVLSFVDEPRTLARASAVSRHWRALLEDDATWQRMCWRSGFRDVSTGERLKSLEFGARDERPLNTPAGCDRKRQEQRVAAASDASPWDPVAPRVRRVSGLGLDTPLAGMYRARPRAPPASEHAPPLVPAPPERSPELARSPDTDAELPVMPGSLPMSREATQVHVASAPGASPAAGSSRFAPFIADTPSELADFAASHEMNRRSFAHSADDLSLHLAESPVASGAQTAGAATPVRPRTDIGKAHAFTYKNHFKQAYLTESNWLKGPGTQLSSQMSREDGVVTGLCYNEDYIVVAMEKPNIFVFSAQTGLYVRSLVGHEAGVWCLYLVGKGGERDPTHDTPDAGRDRSTRSAYYRADRRGNTSTSRGRRPRARPGGMGLGAGGDTGQSTNQNIACSTVTGYGQASPVIVSGACDRDVRVWNADTGECRFVLRGHASTVRCLRVLEGRPVAVSGSRDNTLRVWDIEKGTALHVLRGHEHSVRCIEVHGNRVVSGSYDRTCRLWDVDTGECLRVFEGHVHQIYAVAFDGLRIVTGSLDSTVRVWSAETGRFLALLQGHTALVGLLQLDPVTNTLVTGGSDGRVLVFSLDTFETVHRLCAHDNSVTSIQFDDRFVVTAGNDGHIFLWDMCSGQLVREIGDKSDGVWRVCFRNDKCVTLFKRNEKPMIEVTTFRP